MPKNKNLNKSTSDENSSLERTETETEDLLKELEEKAFLLTEWEQEELIYRLRDNLENVKRKEKQELRYRFSLPSPSYKEHISCVFSKEHRVVASRAFDNIKTNFNTKEGLDEIRQLWPMWKNSTFQNSHQISDQEFLLFLIFSYTQTQADLAHQPTNIFITSESTKPLIEQIMSIAPGNEFAEWRKSMKEKVKRAIKEDKLEDVELPPVIKVFVDTGQAFDKASINIDLSFLMEILFIICEELTANSTTSATRICEADLWAGKSDPLIEEMLGPEFKKLVKKVMDVIPQYLSVDETILRLFMLNGLKLSEPQLNKIKNLLKKWKPRIKPINSKPQGGSESPVSDDKCKELGSRYLELHKMFSEAKKLYQLVSTKRNWRVIIKTAHDEILDEYIEFIKDGDYQPSKLALEQAAKELDIPFEDVRTLYNYLDRAGMGIKQKTTENQNT